MNNDLIPKDKEEAIKAGLEVLKKEASQITVTSQEGFENASLLLSKVKLHIKRLKELKDGLFKPFKDAIKGADLWFKAQGEPYLELEFFIKDMIQTYADNEMKKAQEVARQKEEARLKAEKEVEEARMAAEKAAKEAKSTAEKEAAQRLANEAKEKQAQASEIVEATVKPNTSARTEGGLVSTSQVWTWELIDPAKVPPAFLTVNNAAVTKAVRSGWRDIPGIRIFQKSQVRVNT